MVLELPLVACFAKMILIQAGLHGPSLWSGYRSPVTGQRPCSPDQGFFLTKINKRVTECSKQAVYSSIQQVLTAEKGVINTRDFWFQLALPSGLACVVLDICLQLIEDEKLLDLGKFSRLTF